MKVLVTGGAGFIGSHTVDLLLKKGYQVRILDSLEPPVHIDRKIPAYVPKDAEVMVGDVRDKEALGKALKGMDFVFHLAAYQGYLPDFSTFAGTNDMSTAAIYEIIVGKKLPVRKVVVASSQAVYGEGKYECRKDGVQYPPFRTLPQLESGDWDVKCPVCGNVLQPVLTDESRVNTHNQYSVSKFCQELYALTLGKRYGIPSVALRYSITQGPRQSFSNAYSGILRVFTTRLLKDLNPVVYEDGTQLRDYVYVGDVAAANVLVMENPICDYEVYNVGGDNAVSVLQYAELVGAALGKSVTLEKHGEFRYGDVRHIISDISKLKGLGWRPETHLDAVIKSYIDWIRQQENVSDHFAEAYKTMKLHNVIRSARRSR